MTVKWILLAGGIVATTSDCGTVCGGTGLSRVIPSAPTLAIGRSVTMVYQEGDSCLPTDNQFHDVKIFWTTTDTLIVSVDSLRGRVVGRATGDAHVVANTPFGPWPVVVRVR